MLSPVTAVIWDALSDWTTNAELGTVLAGRFPDVSEDERSDALDQVLALLDSEGLLQRGGH